VEGNSLLYHYLEEKQIPYKKCGKLIVATRQHELALLQDLLNRGRANGVKNLKLVSADEAKQIEDRVSCLQGLWSPDTGIVDYTLVTNSFAQDALTFSATGSSCIITSFDVGRFKYENYKDKQNKNLLKTDKQENDYIILENVCKKSNETGHQKLVTEVGAKFVVTAGGLWADRLSRMTGADSLPGIVPFRGEYLLLRQDRKQSMTTKTHLHSVQQNKTKTGSDRKKNNDVLTSDPVYRYNNACKVPFQTNIYPVPDPRFPFLGMHFTPRLDGSVIIGPNAVFAFSRTGYSLMDINFKDTLDSISHPGFKKLIFKYFRTGIEEFTRSLSLKQQLEHVNRMISPELKLEDVSRGPSGVRAQALDEDGNLVEDFIFDWGRGVFDGKILHVRNAPSPAATSSLAIAKVIVDKMEEKIHISCL